ncbi:MAG: hypothetical protein K2X77_10660 [Candidatus Obscuribacterales bacterium]|jgi:hypothetical protein|nr:hypothetical protein [Candidatus Obscuribacterales bacterium]
MKVFTTTAVSVLGILIFTASAALAQGNTNHQSAHHQRRLADHQRHDAGIPWQQDRQIHRQERQGDRMQHRINNQNRLGYGGNYNGNSGYYGNLGAGAYQQNQYGAYQQQYPYSNSAVVQQQYPYSQQQYPNSTSGIYTNGYGQNSTNGHVYSADGHRFDHHGNHDDGPNDR